MVGNTAEEVEGWGRGNTSKPKARLSPQSHGSVFSGSLHGMMAVSGVSNSGQVMYSQLQCSAAIEEGIPVADLPGIQTHISPDSLGAANRPVVERN